MDRFLFFIVGAIFGFICGRYTVKDLTPISNVLQSNRYEANKSITRSDINEDEKVSSSQIKVKKSAEAKNAPVALPSDIVSSETKKIASGIVDGVFIPSHLNISEDIVSEFLISRKIDINVELPQTTNFVIVPTYISRISGKFQGRVRLDGKDLGEIKVELNPDKTLLVDGALKGISDIKINLDAAQGDSSRNERQLAIRQMSGTAKGFLLYSFPSFFLQTFYLENEDALVGNLYEKSKFQDKSTMIGNFFLQRVDPI